MMRALIESPVFRNCKIEYLIRDVMGSKYGRALAGMDKSRAIGALTAPIATAIAIGTFAPELREKQSIKLVVPGAEMVDHFDYGQWYQMIGWLLGVEELHIEVTHVGPRIGTSNGRDIQSHYRELPKDLGFVHSNSSRKYLGEYLESTNQKFDFAMIFQPGFSAHSQWFKDGGLRKLIDDGTKICVSAYAESELPDELFISKFFGFGTTLSSVVENPYSFGSLKQAGEPKFLAENKWGSLLWQLERRPAPAVEFSDRYVYAVDVVQSQAEAVGLNGMDAMIAYNNSLRSFGVLVAKRNGARLA